MTKDDLKLLITPDYSSLELRIMGHLLDSSQFKVNILNGSFKILDTGPLTLEEVTDITASFQVTIAPKSPPGRRPNQPWYRQFDKRRT